MKWGARECSTELRSFIRAVLGRAPLVRRVYYQIWYKIPWRISVLLPSLYKRMLMIAIALLRFAAKRKQPHPGLTVVIVTWNSLKFLPTTLAAIREYGGSGVKVTVIDNHSRDGVHQFLRKEHPDVRFVRLPGNIHHESHGLAMDIGFLLARTEFVVSLDVDAFPTSPNWLPTLLDPLNHGYRVSGVHQHRSFAHPCCLAMRFRDFVDGSHTFSSNWGDGSNLGVDRWDTGELISMREKGRVFLIEMSAVRGPGRYLGSVFGDVLYHNFYSTVHRGNPHLLVGLGRPGEVPLAKISLADVLAAWKEAEEKYLSKSGTLA